MEELIKYLREILGKEIQVLKASSEQTNSLPFFLKENYEFYAAALFGRELLFARPKTEELPNPSQIQKQVEAIRNSTKRTVVLLTGDVPAIIRNRLIQKSIDFITPHKQMFLPSLLIDLKEPFKKHKYLKGLLPSSQVIVLFRLLNKSKDIETLPLKALALELGYSAMAVTKAAENLHHHGICNIVGSKEKYLRFNFSGHELWNRINPLLINPILKIMYVDEYPHAKTVPLLLSGLSALSDYSNLNPSIQECRAIEKRAYYKLQKKESSHDLNEYSGRHCLQVWKYDPASLVQDITDQATVDPLSLYLSLKDSQDERIQMALDELINKIEW